MAERVTVPKEALVYLGCVAVFVIILIVFFMYLNKKLCFKNIGGFPCIDRPKERRVDNKLGAAYAYEQEETSSDSEEENLKIFHQAKRNSMGNIVIENTVNFDKAMLAEDYPRYDGQSYQMDTSYQDYQKDSAPLMESIEITVTPAETVDTVDAAPSGYGYGSMSPTPQSVLTIPRPSLASSVSGQMDVSAVSIGGTESIFTEGEQQLFDITDLNAESKTDLISKCGQLDVSFDYQPEQATLTVTVNYAKDIPTKERGGAKNTRIRMLLLPGKKQHKTRMRTGENPTFDETFIFKLPLDGAGEMGIRFRVYGCERMRKERLIGERVVGLASLGLENPQTKLLTLEPRADIKSADVSDAASLADARSDITSIASQSLSGGLPELFLGLAYNATTGRLSVEVIRGSHFRNISMHRAPDTYVSLTFMSANGLEIARSKTSIRRAQPNPLFKETYVFQVALFQLTDVTLMVTVYNKKSMSKKELIGWFATGLNSSGEEELAHWKDMVDAKGEKVTRWHVLLEG